MSKRTHLTRNQVFCIYDLMKDYVELGDKISGVQYAVYKDKVRGADGTVERMTDARMAEIAANRFGHPVTEIQIRKLRTDMFGQVYREKREKKPDIPVMV